MVKWTEVNSSKMNVSTLVIKHCDEEKTDLRMTPKLYAYITKTVQFIEISVGTGLMGVGAGQYDTFL